MNMAVTQQHAKQEEWSQIQIVNSLSDITKGAFAPGASMMLYRAPLSGDFDGLTQHMIHLMNTDESAQIYGYSDRMQRHGGVSVEPYWLDKVVRDVNIDPKVREAAQNFHEVIRQIVNGSITRHSKISIETSDYLSLENDWHTDSMIMDRRIGMRVSGNPTEIAHNDDVLEERYDDNKSRMVDNPRIFRTALCDVWANIPGNKAISQLMSDKVRGLFDLPSTYPQASTHRRVGGSDGLIFTTNMPM